MKDQLKELTSIWFILSVGILITNDFLLKGWYGNWITGKLSDIFGLLAFSLFVLTLLPKKSTGYLWLIGGLFVYWKSPYSQPLINAWNSFTSLTVHRVVDCTDLIALLALPVAHLIYTRRGQLYYLKLSPVFPLLISVFSFCATSYYQELNVHKRYEFSCSKEELIRRINRIRVETRQPIVSQFIANANDFTIQGEDTVAYFFSREQAIIDTFRNMNQEIDSIVPRVIGIKDSTYLNEDGQFRHYIMTEDYFYTINVEMRLEGDEHNSALILIKGRLDNAVLEEENKEEVIVKLVEKQLINKIKAIGGFG